MDVPMAYQERPCHAALERLEQGKSWPAKEGFRNSTWQATDLRTAKRRSLWGNDLGFLPPLVPPVREQMSGQKGGSLPGN